MTIDEALTIITQATSQYKGTREEHSLIVQAIEEIKKVLSSKAEHAIEKKSQKE